jgi:hypothetical protein
MRPDSRIHRLVRTARNLAALCIITSAATDATLSGDGGPPAEPGLGKATVYFVTGTTSFVRYDVFLEREYLGTAEPKTYGVAAIDPQRARLWVKAWNGVRLGWFEKMVPACVVPAELTAGETYYFYFEMLPGRHRSPSAPVFAQSGVINCVLIDATSGAALVEGLKEGTAPSGKDRKRARDFADLEFPAQYYPPLTSAASGSGLEAASTNADDVVVPAGTKFTLDLMTTVTSSRTERFAPVLFRVASDISIGGQVVVPRGQVVKGLVRDVLEGRGSGQPGYLDIDIPMFGVGSNPAVPAILQAVGRGGGVPGADGAHRAAMIAGRSYATSYFAAPLTGWDLNPMLAAPLLIVDWIVKGDEAYLLAGTRFAGVTRAPLRTRRQPTTPAPENAERVRLTARSLHSLRFLPYKRDPVDAVVVEIESDITPVNARIVQVGASRLPTPIVPAETKRGDNGTQLIFDGWQVVQYVEGVEKPIVRTPLLLEGTLTDGRPWMAETPLAVEIIERQSTATEGNRGQ